MQHDMYPLYTLEAAAFSWNGKCYVVLNGAETLKG